MSRMEEFIKEKCPEGVEYKTLGELGEFIGGITGKSKDDFFDGNAVFITYKNVYSNPALDIEPLERVKISEGEIQRTLKYGDVIFTGSSETSDECGISSVITKHPIEKLYLNSFCFVFRVNDLSIIEPNFAKHLFRSYYLRNQISKTAAGVTRYNVSKNKMKKVIIPIPPIEVQQEIVRILDKFTELEAELQAELDARKKQYEHYSDELLAFSSDVEIVPLEKCAEIGTGSSNTVDGIEGGLYPFYVRSQKPLTMDSYEFDEIATITAGDGVGVGKVFHFVNGKYALHQRAYRIHITDGRINPKFFHYYFMVKFPKFIFGNMYEGSVPSIRRPMLNKFEVPVPSLQEQNRIVEILDKFEEYCNNPKTGLPAEIQARHKQYEYYRDKLLTFKRKEV